MKKTTTNNNLLDKFISTYTQPCFGALSKKEIDLLVFNMILETKYQPNKLDIQKISRDLCISASKIKLLYYELQLRLKTNDNEWFRNKFFSSLCNARLSESDKRIEIYADEILYRKELESRIKNIGGFPDYSFNRDILRIDFPTYSGLIEELCDDVEKGNFVKIAIPEKYSEYQNDKKLWRQILEKFLISAAESAGKESAKKIVNLGFGLLTGGMTEMTDAISTFVQRK